MRLYERSTGGSPVEDVRLGAESGLFCGQDARAPLFRVCLGVFESRKKTRGYSLGARSNAPARTTCCSSWAGRIS